MSFVFLPPATIVFEYCAMGFSSRGSNTKTRSSTTWTTRLIPLLENCGCGLADKDPSPVHEGWSRMDVTKGSSFALKGRTRTGCQSCLQ